MSVDEGEPYVRVDGRAPCPECTVDYRRHPRELVFTEMGEEVWMRRGCDGMLLKT